MFSPRRMIAVAKKEMRHLFRDPRMRPVIFVIPVIQLILLGYAANLDVIGVKVMVVDRDHSAVSHEIIARIDANEAFTLVGVTDEEPEAERALNRGAAELVVLVPQGTKRGLTRAEVVGLPIWVDGTDTNRGLQAQGMISTILADVSANHVQIDPRLAQSMASALPGRPSPRVRVLYNPTLASRWFMVPGVVVMVLAVITMVLSAMAIVKERENGTIEQLVVTPIRASELIVGKLLPFVFVGLVIAFLTTWAAVLIFGVPFRGSLLDLLVMSLLFLMSTLGIGLFASTISATQQQSMLSAMMVLMPSFLLGGVFYPVTNMPQWAQVVADLTPVRHFIAMVRAVFLKGVGVDVLWRESLALAVIGVVVLAFAVFRFRKRSA